MRLPDGARIAVIGAGPSGLATAKHALEAGFDTTVFEASGDLGGQWQTGAAHSGVWPGMHTNTSRAMTAFSDFPAPASHPLHPAAEQIHAYLRAYAEAFGVTPRIRFGARVERVAPGWEVDGERFDAVAVASGRFRRPRMAPGIDRFGGELLHAFDYPGAEPFRGRRVLVYGNGISGLEIASDLAGTADVISAFRKPRYVIRKVVDGVSSDWQWYTAFGALERARLPPAEFGRRLRERIVRVAGDPAAFGAPAPDPDILVAGVSLCQDYLAQVADGSIACRPAIDAVERDAVRFADGTREAVDAIVCATGTSSTCRSWTPPSGRSPAPISASTAARCTRTCPASARSACSRRRARSSRCSSSRRAGSWRSGPATRSRRTPRRCAARSRSRRRRSRCTTCSRPPWPPSSGSRPTCSPGPS